ncbi:MAG: hypothetical protein QXD93_00365 [Ignisphaera sp.]|uniref:DNA replication complex GINS family protein n=1 Tax=Ignisphaera aggregans TaxID=334771 RepID=A0A7C4H354_9CREN
MILRLLKLMYELQPVKTTILKSCKKIPLIDSSLQKGSQVPLPRALAKILENNGLAEITEGIISQQDLARVRFSHMQQKGSLLKIDDFFYMKAKESIKMFMVKAKTEGDIVTLRTTEKMREDFTDIASVRLSGILRALQLGGIDIIEKNCTIEEKILINIIQNNYNQWIKEFVELNDR